MPISRSAAVAASAIAVGSYFLKGSPFPNDASANREQKTQNGREYRTREGNSSERGANPTKGRAEPDTTSRAS